MKFTLARQKSLAEQTLRSLKRTALNEIIVVRDENIFDVIGVIEEEDVLWPQLEIDKVSVLFGHVSQEGGRVAPEGEEVSDGQQALRAWRKLLRYAQL